MVRPGPDARTHVERDHAYLEQEFGASIDILAEQWGPLEEVFLGYTAEARSLLHRLW